MASRMSFILNDLNPAVSFDQKFIWQKMLEFAGGVMKVMLLSSRRDRAFHAGNLLHDERPSLRRVVSSENLQLTPQRGAFAARRGKL